MAKYRPHLIRLSASLGEVLTDKSVEEEFNHIIRLNTGFIPKRGIRLKQTSYPSQTYNWSQTDNSSLI